MRIFNHDIMTCTHEQVVGNHLYSGRVLGMTEPGDVVQLHPDLKPEWDAIANHYDRIGLSHSHDVIWKVCLDLISNTPECRPSVFYFGDAVHSGSPIAEQFRKVDEDWFRVVDFINSKNNFMQLANKLGVVVPHTLCFANKANLSMDQPFPLPCYVKPSVSVDGMGIVRCANQDQLSQTLNNWDSDFPFQIQAEVNASTFLNLQYQVTTDGVKRLAATEQILDGCSHSGNRYPTAHQPWDIVEPMAEWMAAQGMKEIFAFDVAVVEEPESTRYLAIECNPRFNGASYPTGIAHKLDIGSWSSETFTTSYRSLHKLDLKDIEFDPARGEGVVIVNWGSILVGKLAILLAGSIDTQDHLRTLLKQRL